jgi:phosphoribosylformylglycinamidine synthase
VWLFSESTGRVLVSIKEAADRDLASLCRLNGVMLTKLGVVTAEEDATLDVVGQFTLPLARIREAWQGTIPAAMHV